MAFGWGREPSRKEMRKGEGVTRLVLNGAWRRATYGMCRGMVPAYRVACGCAHRWTAGGGRRAAGGGRWCWGERRTRSQ